MSLCLWLVIRNCHWDSARAWHPLSRNCRISRARTLSFVEARAVEERFIGNANLFSVEEREEILQTKLTHVTPQELTAPYYEKCKGLE